MVLNLTSSVKMDFLEYFCCQQLCVILLNCLWNMLCYLPHGLVAQNFEQDIIIK